MALKVSGWDPTVLVRFCGETGSGPWERHARGRSAWRFRMMVIDIQTIRDGKIAKTYYMENWLSALSQ